MSEVRPLFVQLPILVKTYDIDYATIVHNAVYIRWLEDLRYKILAVYYPLEKMLAAGQSPILTKTEIAYQWPVRLGDAVVGSMWVSDLRRVRWQVQAEIAVGEQVAATAVQSGYFADLETLRPIRIPNELRAQWEAARP